MPTLELPADLIAETVAIRRCFMFLGAGDAAHAFPNHHPAFDVDENAMQTGIQSHVAIALAATAR